MNGQIESAVAGLEGTWLDEPVRRVRINPDQRSVRLQVEHRTRGPAHLWPRGKYGNLAREGTGRKQVIRIKIPNQLA